MTLDDIAGIVKPHNDLILARAELEMAAAVMEQVATMLDEQPIGLPATARVLRQHAARARTAAANCTGRMP